MAAALRAARLLRVPAPRWPRPAWISHDAERRHLPPQPSIPPPAKYGGRHTVTLIPGDGIGPELMLHVKEVFRHACVPVDFEEVRVGAEAPEADVHNAIMAIRRNGVAIKGNIETNHNLPPSHKSRNNLIRTSLDLYANVIHCQSLPGVETRHRDVDILIVRENTEGEYSSLEHESVAGVVESLKIITAGRSRRIAHYAFGLARAAKRRSVTAVLNCLEVYLCLCQCALWELCFVFIWHQVILACVSYLIFGVLLPSVEQTTFACWLSNLEHK